MNRLACKKQSNVLQKAIFCFLESKSHYITDNKFLWRVFKPKFSNKKISANRVTLTDGGGYRKDY